MPHTVFDFVSIASQVANPTGITSGQTTVQLPAGDAAALTAFPIVARIDGNEYVLFTGPGDLSHNFPIQRGYTQGGTGVAHSPGAPIIFPLTAEQMNALEHAELSWQGTWSSSPAYIPGDIVTFAGSSWLCLVANTNSSPSALNSNWASFATGTDTLSGPLVDRPSASTHSGAVYVATDVLIAYFSNGTSWAALTAVPSGTSLPPATADYAQTWYVRTTDNTIWLCTGSPTLVWIQVGGVNIPDATTSAVGLVELRTPASGAHPVALTTDDLAVNSGVATLDGSSHVLLSQLSALTHNQLSSSAGVLLSQLGQDGATTNQVPQWSGSAWVASTLAGPYTLPDATTSILGGVKLRTTASGAHPIALTTDDMGVASGLATLDGSTLVPVAQLPKATSSAFGVVKPDNTTITISAGVISSVGGGGSSTLAGDTDVSLGTLTDGQDLRYDLASGKWKNKPPVVSVYALEVLRDRPVAYYRLGEPSGTSAFDYSGNGVTGTYKSGATLGANGATANVDKDTALSANAWSFDAAPTNLPLGAAVRTTEIWLADTMSSASQNYPMLLSYGAAGEEGGGGATGEMWNMTLAPNDSDATHVTLDTWGDHTTWTVPANNDGQMHHFVVTWDGVNLTAYWDGALLSSQVPSVTPNTVVNGGNVLDNLAMGDRTGGLGGHHYIGTLDEAAIYNYVLSPDRILAHYNAGVGRDASVFNALTVRALPNPLVAPVVTAHVDGSYDIGAGTYGVAFAWVTPWGKTLPSPIGHATLSGFGYLTAASVAIGPPGTIARELYMTTNGGSTLFLVSTSYGGNTIFDNVSTTTGIIDGRASGPIAAPSTNTSGGQLTMTGPLSLNGGVGTNGQIATSQGAGLPAQWSSLATLGAASDPTTTQGDLIVRGASVLQRLAGGTAGTYLRGAGASTIPTYSSILAADLPLATTGAFGAVKPDGSTITISAGVISSTGGGGSATGASVNKVQLDYALASDLSNVAISATTWSDVIGNQTFTVDDAQSVVEFDVSGVLLVSTTSSNQNVMVRLAIDSAGTATYVDLGGMFSNAATTFYNALAGVGTQVVSGLSAGSHTVKIQMYAAGAGNYYCQPSSAPNSYFLRMQIIERKVVPTGASGTLDICVLTGPTNSCSNGVATPLTWPTEVVDPNDLHSTSTNTSRVTIATPGTYDISGMIEFAPNSSGQRLILLYKNGSAIAQLAEWNASGAGASDFPFFYAASLAIGDYLEIYGYQSSGISLAVAAVSLWEVRRADGYAINPMTGANDLVIGGASGVPTRFAEPGANKMLLTDGSGNWTSQVVPGQELAYASITSAVTGNFTSDTDVTGLNVSFIAPSGKCYVEVFAPLVDDTVSTAAIRYSIKLIDVTASNALVGSAFAQANSGDGSFFHAMFPVTPGSGSRNYKIQIADGVSGTGRWYAASNAISFIRVIQA